MPRILHEQSIAPLAATLLSPQEPRVGTNSANSGPRRENATAPLNEKNVE